jgi:hypothetical protein
MQGSPSGFAFWRLGLWLVLLLAAFGAMQYGVHAGKVWHVLAQPALDATARSALHGMLAWDLAYFVAAAALVVFCAAGVLRQGWSRPVLRVALGLLAIGFLASGATLYRGWMALPESLRGLAGTAGTGIPAARTVYLSLALDGLAIVLLLWLVWRLGQPAVRAQFRRR